MRVTAAELITELQKLQPDANVTFKIINRIGHDVASASGLQRVDNHGKHAVVVVDSSV